MLHLGKTDWTARDGSDFGCSLKEVGDRMIAETVHLGDRGGESSRFEADKVKLDVVGGSLLVSPQIHQLFRGWSLQRLLSATMH